jgi:DNA-binding NarL/FixJ family response regulator
MTIGCGNSDGRIRVAYIDDQTVFREALTSALQEGDGIAVIANRGHGNGGFRAFLDTPVSAILVGLDSQAHEAMATVRELRDLMPGVPLCALVVADNLDRTREALAAGCKGAVSTAASVGMLIAALENLAQGQAFVDPLLGGRLIAKSISRKAATSSGNRNGSRSTLGPEVSRN